MGKKAADDVNSLDDLANAERKKPLSGNGSKSIPDEARNIAKQVKANNGAAPKGYKGGRTYKNVPLEDGA